MSLNFSAFTVQKTANVRESIAGQKRGQSFKLKFRKYLSKKNGKEAIETGYTLSNDKFTELGLETNGIMQVVSPEGVPYIAVVGNDDATMLKRTDKLKEGAEKGKKFKSTILDTALLAQGTIEDKEGATQFLDLEKVEGSEGVEIMGVKIVALYAVVKGEGEDDETEDEKKSADNESHEEDAVDNQAGSTGTMQEEASAPQAESTSQAPQASTDDDF